MPQIVGFGAQDKLKVEAAFKKCLRIVEDVEKRFDETKARQAFDTIMCANKPVPKSAAEILLKQTLTAILLRMRTPIFRIECDTAGVLQGMYASMDAIAPQRGLDPSAPTAFAKEDTMGNVTPGHWDIREVASVTDQMRSGFVGPKSSTLVNGVSVLTKPGPAGELPTLPLRLNPIVCGFPEISLDNPSLTGTLIHELSHLSAATIDDDTYGNPYGRGGVKNLAEQGGPDRAVRNAENVAYFCIHATHVC
jgi:hypothetical protein